jgi:hypothetical protein
MTSWNRNEPLPEKRRAQIFVYDIDGQPAPATTLFTGTNELLVDKGDGHFVAAGGTLVNTDRPLVIADTVFTAENVANLFTAAAHGMLTGDGPVTVANSGGGLPAGLAAATNYWVVKISDNTFKLATSLANALAGTTVDITTDGTGTQTLSDAAGTKRLNDGNWYYEASQAEIDYRGSYFAIRISKTNFRDLVHTVPLEENFEIHAGTAQSATASTIRLDAAGASSTNDFYNDAIIVITGGTGKGQFRTITDYVGADKDATIDRNWTTNPDSTSTFTIFAAPAAANASSVASSVWAAVGEGAHTYGDLMRAIVSLNGCKVTDFTTGTLVFKSINAAKTRWTVTTDATGRLTATVGDLTA